VIKTQKLGIPYMGSKRNLAHKIVDKIIEDNPDAEYFYDLFGGGGAVALEALSRDQFKGVYYNEFNTGITKLMEDIRDNGISDYYYNWVSREEFFKNLGQPTVLGGLMVAMWSFGNDGKSYLYGKKVEGIKHIAHKIVVDKDLEAIDEFNTYYNGLSLDFDKDIDADTINERRLNFGRYVRCNKLNKIQQLEHLTRLNKLKQLDRIQHLGRLNSLKKLNGIQGLNISNLSYDEIPIKTPIDKTVIYLDPPYEGTQKYQNAIDFNKLKDWIVNNKYKCYKSEYSCDYMTEVMSMEHRSKLCATANNKVSEKLYTNKEK